MYNWHMLKLNTLMIGTTNLEAMSSFYTKVFGRKPDMADTDYHGWDANGCYFTIGKHSKMEGKTKDPGRVMFNFETDDVKGEFEKIKVLEGVEIIAEPYTMEGWEKHWIATIADPDGNYFQLVTPMTDEDMEKMKEMGAK